MLLKALRFRFGLGRTTPWNGQEAALAVRLSKIVDYLADNFYILMLSEVRREIKEKMEGLQAQFQIGNPAACDRGNP